MCQGALLGFLGDLEAPTSVYLWTQWQSWHLPHFDALMLMVLIVELPMGWLLLAQCMYI
jgi:hypothetical protein